MSVPVLHARLLGEFQLSHGATPLGGALSPRLQALLAYLLLHHDTHLSRQQLAFHFWPGSAEPQARTNLRKALHRLRQLLPVLDDYLDLDGAVLAWRPGAPLSLDVAELETGLRAAQTAPLTDQPALLAAALAFYKGQLLPALYDDWVLVRREELHQQVLDALDLLAGLQEAQRAYGPSSQTVRRLLREDPLRERSYRRLMRLQALAGDVAAALHTYHQCAALLEQELGVEPSPATQAAYHQLLHKQATPGEPPTRETPRQIPLVGRDAAWQTLLAAWRAAAAGRSQVVLVSGEAGIGKTRLAEELLTWAGRQGITSLRAACFAAAAPLPLAPVAGWLRAAPVQAALPSLPPRWRGEVARLLPELLAADPAWPAPPPGSDPWQKQQLFSAMAAAVTAAGAPLLLFLDDLHWAGDNTLAWLHFLARRNQETHFLLLATLRSEELAGNHALLTWQQEMALTVPTQHITLPRLDGAETAALAAHLLRAELEPAAAEALYRATEGVPLFAVEMARAGLEGTAAELPHQIRAAIELHLARLSPAARELVGLAALIGRTFNFPLLAAASPEPEAVAVRALDELWQRQVVREQAAGDDTYDFSHDQLRQVALAQLSSARRRWGHRRVAGALAQLYAPSLDAHHGQIAVHWEGAGEPQRAVTHYVHAARVATRLYAHEEATRLLRHALALLPAADPRCAELYARLGEAQIRLSRYTDAAAAFAQAAAAAEDPVEQARLTGRRVAALSGDLQFPAARKAYHEAMAHLDVIPGFARDERAWQIWLDLQFSLLDVLYFEHSRAEMTPIVAAMAAPLEAYSTPRQRSQYAHFRARMNFLSLSFRFELDQDAVALATESLHWARQTDDDAFIASQTFTLGFALLWAGRLPEAIENLQYAATQMESLGIVPNHSRSLTYLGIAYRLQGDAGRVRQLLEQHAAVFAADANPHYLGVAAAQRAWLAWRGGDPAAAAYAQTARDLWGPLDQTAYPIQWPARLPLLASALETGAIAVARAQAEILLSPHLQRLTRPVEDALRAAVAANSLSAAAPHLRQACVHAQAHGYL